MNAKKNIKLGTWYWLNAGPQEEWEEDIRNIKNLGYDYLVAGWGLDISLVREKKDDTLKMLELCNDYGIEVYLVVWSAMTMYPYLGKGNQQIDSSGQSKNYYNLWNSQWREGPYKRYIQDIVNSYRKCPALKGYLFDDTFSSYPVKYDSGAYRYISYGRKDTERFRKWLKQKYKTVSNINYFLYSDKKEFSSWDTIMPPEKPGGSMWLEWYEARGEWYEEWAKDTKRYFSDMDSQHELFLLDGIGNAIGENIECYGINFRHLTEYFDVVMLYAMPSGFDKPDVDMDKILSAVDFMNSSSKRFSINKKIAFDFHVYQPFGDDFDRVSSWPYPSLEQIKRITEQAVKSGADMIDHYGYRIGNWRLKNVAPYPLVPEVKTMLRYREDLWEGLREFNRTLK